MGGGASLMEGVEELVTTTILIGRAISAMTFPGMYRIYDFHSKKAPRLKNVRNFTFFGPDSEEDEENDHETDIDPSDYSHFFKVTVNGDDVYIEDPLEPNEAGWTPLHTCCMSLSTVSAGLTLIEEIVRRGGSFELKTIQGPGTFNRGWTPLQMACAYGIDPLVEKLVESGADPNAVNSFGYSCLLEGCHRGFADIVRTLLKNKVDLSYIPDPQVAGSSPFMSAPCQSALGESARCGFYKIVQMIIDAGANKNLPNHLGWTPLHEACFYHRVETVKTLLLAGADPTLRTNLGALPYHLTGLNEIRGMLESMGGAGAVPAEGDTIDMVKVLTELTMLDGTDKDELNETPENHHSMIMSSGFSQMPIVLIPLSSIDSTSSDPHRSDIDRKNFETSSPRRTDSKSLENKSCNDLAGTLLHSGRVLGNLPALTPGKSPTKNLSSELDRALTLNERHNSNILSASHGADPKSSSQKKLINNNVAEDFPKQYLCQLTQKPMSCPVKTIYGNIYDKDAILNWFSQQGRICPLTGAPLAEIDLSPLPELESEIRQYILKKSLQKENLKDESSRRRNENKNPTTEDLYDF